MKRIIDYLVKTYAPHTILLYGSYADGSNNTGSDFDALLITDNVCARHDGRVIDDVPLDVFIYHTSKFEGEVDCRDFLQLHDAALLLDSRGMGLRLKNEVLAYIEQMPQKSPVEKLHMVEWCEKMLLRAARGDAEGYFRWHWLLSDSLEIYFELWGERYLGPKKALARLKMQDPETFECYSQALSTFEYEAARSWIDRLRSRLGQ